MLPSGLRTRIRGIQVQGKAVEQAPSAHRTALNLNAVTTDDVRPGSSICTPDAVTPTDHFDVDITYLGLHDQDKPLETGCRVHVAHGTTECIGHVLLMDGVKSISKSNGRSADSYGVRPTVVRATDSSSVQHPPRPRDRRRGAACPPEAHHHGNPRRTARCSTRFARAMARRRCRPPSMLPSSLSLPPILPMQPGFPLRTTADQLEALAERGTAEKLAEAAGASNRIRDRDVCCRSFRGRSPNALLRFHSANPAATGMSKDALRQACMPRCAPDAFDAVLARACAKGKAVADGGMISHPQAGAGARKLEEDNAEKLAELLAAAGPKPPTVADLLEQADLASKQGYKALGLLEKQGRAIKASEEFYFDAAVLAALEQAVRAALANGPASAADLKDAMGLSRKHAIPVLEHFDDTGVTRRVGDARELAS